MPTSAQRPGVSAGRHSRDTIAGGSLLCEAGTGARRPRLWAIAQSVRADRTRCRKPRHLGEARHGQLQLPRQRSRRARRELGPRSAAALRAAQRARPQGRQVRLRPGAVRRLHGAGGRRGGALLRDAGERRRRKIRDHAGRAGLAGASRSRAGRLHRRAGGAVRLLHQRHGDEREGAAARRTRIRAPIR